LVDATGILSVGDPNAATRPPVLGAPGPAKTTSSEASFFSTKKVAIFDLGWGGMVSESLR
jgi:hypothetical protein